LARIHRLTINRLRAEIQPVSLQDFQRFLLAWQRVDAAHKTEGPEGVEAVLELLNGFELAAAAWEPEALALRVKEYSPEWLDRLCFTGRIGWGRLSPAQNQKARSCAPIRSSPISLFLRESLPQWLQLSVPVPVSEFAPETQLVMKTLSQSGAMFFSELTRATKLLPSQAEQALAELAGQGWVTADSFEGLRALLVPAEKRVPFADTGRKRHHKSVTSVESAGRWTLLRPPTAPQESELVPQLRDEAVEAFARVLLRRYGIVFRRLLERESLNVTWYELGKTFRRLEARGEIRGGHFVNGVSGEQFALPEAIGLLRSTRKAEATGELIVINATDPLNLIGILTPGARVTSITANRILLKDGLPIAGLEGGQIIPLDGSADVNNSAIEQSLKVGKMPPALRKYYA